MTMGEAFTEIQVPRQRNYNGIRIPAAVSPRPITSCLSMSDVIETIKKEKQYLESLLLESGAILFRGFPINTASDFNDFIEAFGYEELPYTGGNAPRVNIVGRVFTANEAPPDRKIQFHHEMAQLPTYPSKLFFFCEVEPKSGGETPIVPSHIVYERMKQKHPEFVEQLEKHGLIYTRVLGAENNSSSPIGRGWKSTFSTDDKVTAEKRAAEQCTRLEWLEDGVKTIMGPIPAIKYDERRNRKIWFNNMVAAYTAWKDERNDPQKTVIFGDGRPLPEDMVYDCLKILEEESIAIPYQKGDVLLIDNFAVLHSRSSFVPPRRVLASLVK